MIAGSSDHLKVDCPAHGGAGLVSELGLYPKSGGASVSG